MKYIKQGSDKTASDKILDLAISSVILVMVLWISCANILHYDYKLNADIASDAILVEVVWESKEWLPDSWYPATELRVIGTPNWAVPFYGLTENITLAVGIACILMTIGICCSGYFFAAKCGFSVKGRLLFVLLCLVLPNNFSILELLYLWAGYYSIHVIVMFVVLGLYAGMLKGQSLKKSEWIMMLVTGILSWVLGVQGTRSILILSGPLIVIEVIKFTYQLFRKETTIKRDVITIGWISGLLICGWLGTRLAVSVGQDISRNIRRGLFKFGDVVLNDISRCVGWNETGILGKAVLAIGGLLIAAELVQLLYKVIRKEEIKAEEWILLFLIASPVMTAVFISFTTLDSSIRYYFVLLFTIAFALVKWIEEMSARSRIFSWIASVLTVLLIFQNYQTIYGPVLKSNAPQGNPQYEVVCYLEENQYYNAYATFENANTMTVLSDGIVQVSPVSSIGKMDACKWLSSKEWYVPNVPKEEKTAYIVTESEQKEFEEFLALHTDEIQFATQINKYLIYFSDFNYSSLEN